MKNITAIKESHNFIVFRKLIVASILIGFLSSFLAVALKHITDYYEEILFLKTEEHWWYLLVFPVFGLSIIYFLRQYMFRKKENKGIREIFESTASTSKNLPAYKIPSHFINGVLTVIFGGSTGIEVSTVVATATIGSLAQQKQNVFRRYKTELISAGIAAGITALFGSPIAGILFVFEVITKKTNKVFALTLSVSVLTALAFCMVLDEQPLFARNISVWHFSAIPYFILLGILAGMNGVYLTKSVIYIKKSFLKISKTYSRIFLGGAILSISLLVLPQLYGDGYHAVKDIFIQSPLTLSFSLAITLLAVILLKPILTAVTLASGGDGGVFAPGLFLGAFLGLFVALFVNSFFGAGVIVINFVIIGMAAVLSASIHAPFTALFLVCGIIGDYTLFLPILVTCLISKYVSKLMFPYTVYTVS